MLYNTDKILADTLVAINVLYSADDPLLADMDVCHIIASKIEEGATMAVMGAPAWKLAPGRSIGSEAALLAASEPQGNGDIAIAWERSTGAGSILLPTDFARLISFRMSDWQRAATKAITPDDCAYARQQSPYAGLRGTPENPVCAIVPSPLGLRLEFYSCKSASATVAEASYAPLPKIDAHSGIEIPEKCYLAAIYAIASLTFATLGEQEKAETFNQLSLNNLQK